MELSLAEIRNFMIQNGCKVTNHALVKHFKEFLTNPDTQNEARKQFKTYVNILATIRTEDKRDGSNEKEKYLILKAKYLHECPSEDNLSVTSGSILMSPSARSVTSEGEGSPSPRQPPPYRPPPIVSPSSSSAGLPVKLPLLEPQTHMQYKDCVNEYRNAVLGLQRQTSVDSSSSVELRRSDSHDEVPPQVPPRKRSSAERSFSVDKSSSDDSVNEANKENVAIMEEMLEIAAESENQISVKEATKKFNRIASEEEKIISPSAKKKPEKTVEDITDQATLVSDPKAKEWLVSAARCNYQELSKLASERPWLVKLQDPTTTALHWAAKHGNENVVKLIAGTYKANANVQTNGGYTPLHIAMQFGRDNIFELLQNVYKADRDVLDWSGKKPLDYRRQKTAVSASTYSKIKAKKKHTERESGFLRIGSLRNFLGVGSSSSSNSSGHHGTQNRNLIRSSVPSGKFSTSTERFDKLHKSWGSADNLPHNPSNMPPPKNGGTSKKRRTRRHADYSAVLPPGMGSVGSQSMPTTPNQPRAPIPILSEHPQGSMGDSDSDSACGFDSNWNGSYGVRPTYI